MFELLTAAARILRRKRHDSDTVTGFYPLSQIESAAVWIDASKAGVAELVSEIQDFFNSRNIRVKIYALNLEELTFFREDTVDASFFHESDINWFGCIKKRKKTPAIDYDVDLFISMIAEDLYAIEDAALCSKAKMRIGRLPKKYYDITVSGQVQAGGSEVFKTLSNLLIKVK